MSGADAWKLIDRWPVPDYNGEGTLWEHQKSGAQLFHLHNSDPENAFAFAFPTFPEDSTGVAHILEHTVLSGSERFPVKDPFLQLLKGSVNTFLNALTYPDRTLYPAASPVAEDLFNMMLVYGDAVFFPLLKEELFRQEGHRLQFIEDGVLERTGVVYNEMKGNYSSHDSVAGERCFQSLFPDTVYRHDSGGDPAAIPQLTYEAFVAFHRRYYHPSNARILLYGDIPTERSLEFLDEHFLSRFDREQPIAPPSRQPRWVAPREFEATYPVDGVDDLSRRSSVTLNWLLMPVVETDQILEMAVLAEIMLGHSGSPLAKALLESGLGQDLSPVVGLETDLAEAIFSVGLRGTDPEHRDAIVSLTVETLTRLAAEGLPADAVEAALRHVEFRNRELKSGPNGLRMMRRSLRTWIYGGSPVAGLDFNDAIVRLRERLAVEPRLFEERIREHLLDNRHRSTVTVRPDASQSRREREALAEELQRRVDTLTGEERDRITTEQAALEALQEAPDDPEVLARIPFLTTEQIPREVMRIPHERRTLAGARDLFLHREFTNGIVYLDLAFDIGELTRRESMLLNLLGAAATEVGIPGLPYDRLNDLINLSSGGISVHVSDQTRYGDRTRVRRMLVVRVRALERTWREAAELMTRILTDVDFADHRRLRQVVDELDEDTSSALIPSGHYFAGLRAITGLHGLAALEEETNGVSQLWALREATRGEGPESVAGVAAELATLTRVLCDPTRMSVNVTADQSVIDEVVAWLPELVRALDERCAHRVLEAGDGLGLVLSPAEGRPQREFLMSSASVAYVAHALRGFAHGEPLAPAQDLLAHVLRTGLLWEKVRMRGGAYGAFASSRATEAIFSMVSYRDPHSAQTLDAYREALEQIALQPLGDADVDLAKVSMLGRELRPLVPRDRGYTNFKRLLHDVTDELRVEVREALRAVTPADVAAVARALLDRFDTGYTVVLGGERALEEWRGAPGVAEAPPVVFALDV